jgi:hypothetical protein
MKSPMAVFLSIVFLIASVLYAPLQAAAASESSQVQRSRAFIVMGYEGLMKDLNSGQGPYLKTLQELLNIPEDKRASTVPALREVAKTYPNIMDFADQILAWNSQQPKMATSGSRATEAPSTALPVSTSLYTGDKLDSALEHLTAGMRVTVYLQNGEQYEGKSAYYSTHRLTIRTPNTQSFTRDQIRAILAPDL